MSASEEGLTKASIAYWLFGLARHQVAQSTYWYSCGHALVHIYIYHIIYHVQTCRFELTEIIMYTNADTDG